MHWSSKKNNPIFKNVRLQVKSGESVGIVGPNGCGKTTLIRVISGVLGPFKGEIYIKSMINLYDLYQK